MTLVQFWNIIVKRWPIILICAVVVIAGAYVVGKQVKPVYQATALIQVAVGSGSTNLNDVLASNQLVQTEVTLATSDPILRQVASHYPGETEQDLAGAVTAAVKPSTQIVEIDVMSTNKSLVADLANDIANTLISQQNEQQTKSVRNDKSLPSPFLLLAQTAQPPVDAFRSDSKLYLEIGAAAGLMLGLLLALLFELLDTRIRSIKALILEMPWPLLTATRRVNEVERLSDPTWQSANIEAYNVLQTRLAFLSSDDPLRCLLVTSPDKSDGKSTVAAHLALNMAQSGKKTLLIDANLRTPSLSQRFGVAPEKAGLSNALVAFTQEAAATFGKQSDVATKASISLDTYIHTVGVPNLRLMPSGPLPPNPSALLASKAMELFYKALIKSEAEFIVIDSHALLGLSDTSTLLTKVDGMILVVDITRADKRKLLEVRNLLGRVDVNVLGCVVNKLKRAESITKWDRPVDRQTQDGSRRGKRRSERSFETNGHARFMTPEISLHTLTAEALDEPAQVN